MKFISKTIILGLLSTTALVAQEEPPSAPATPPQPQAETDPEIIKSNSSYGFGYNTGSQFSQQMSRFGLSSDDIDRERFIKGFLHAVDGKDPENGHDSLNAAMLGLRNLIQEREKMVAEDNLKKGEEFLAENGKKEGVVTTESGLQYEIITKGDGEIYDGTEGAKFMVNYKGTLIDGTEFDASPEGSPVPMTLNVVPGFKEALTLMPVGSKWKLYLKPDLAYRDQRRSDVIGPNSTLIFDLELVEISKPAPKPKAVSEPIQIPPAPESE
ncbi:MAG: FKBP-type peptidyl-prolyl cis-trans isomerase [Verrucomicrobiota bacterium]